MAKHIRAARHYQDRKSPVRLLADRGIAPIARDMKAALRHLGTMLPASAIHYARAGDWYGLRREVDWPHFRQVMRNTFAAIGKVREAGAQLGAKQINEKFKAANRKVRFRKTIVSLDALFEKDVGDQFSFDLYDQSTQERLREAQDELIQQVEDAARDTIEQVILDGAENGLSPEDVLTDIRQLIGLTDTQAQAVLNYRDMLENLDSDALERKLRNGSYDEILQGAIDAGDDLAETMVDQMVSDYTDNFLDYRAAMIAQTESTRAASAGLQDSYEQAISRGVFPADAVTQFWQVAVDERTCEICLSIPDLNPDGVPIGEPFDSIDGQQDAPPDPHPGCRCSLEIITDLDKLPSTEEDQSDA